MGSTTSAHLCLILCLHNLCLILPGSHPGRQETVKGRILTLTAPDTFLTPQQHSPPKVAPSLVPTEDLLTWATGKDDPLKEPKVSGFLPQAWSSTSLFPTAGNFPPITVPPSNTSSRNLPVRWRGLTEHAFLHLPVGVLFPRRSEL